MNAKEQRAAKVARLDVDGIDDLVSVLCDMEATRMHGACLGDLGEALADLTASWRSSDVARVVARARFVEATGAEAGYGLLQRVAGDVVESGSSGDAAAFAATFDRLVRLLKGALTAACSTPDAVS